VDQTASIRVTLQPGEVREVLLRLLQEARDLPEPPDLSEGAPYFLQKSTATGWPGYSGHVSEASAEKGRKLVQISEDGIVKLIENWLNHNEAPGSW